VHALDVCFFSSRRRHTRFSRDWSSDVCSSDLPRNRRADRPRGPSGGPSRRPGALAAGRAARHHGTWGRAALVIPVFRRTAVSILVPVVFALAAAFSNALATVLQRKAALTVPRSDTLRAGLMLDLLRRPVWLAGIAAVIAAAVCQAVALATGPLTVVQPLLVMELPLALVTGTALLRGGRSRAGWTAVLAVVAGLVVALGAASPSRNRTHVPMDRWLPALAVCAGVIAALVAAALRRPEGRA